MGILSHRGQHRDRRLNSEGDHVAAGSTTSQMASGLDGLSHEIGDHEFVAGHQSGIYRAACGASVLPADLGFAAENLCSRCAEVLAVVHEPAAYHSRATRRRVTASLRAWCRTASRTLEMGAV
jgi:hypothetical protein